MRKNILLVYVFLFMAAIFSEVVAQNQPTTPLLAIQEIGNRHGQELWSARVTLDYRVLAFKRAGADGVLTYFAIDAARKLMQA